MSAADPLHGVRICILTAYDVIHDGRVRKQARALSGAGAAVTVVGHGTPQDADELAAEPYDVALVPRSDRIALATHRAGQRGLLNRALSAGKSLGGRAVATFTPQALLQRYFHSSDMVDAVVASDPDVIHVHNDLTVPTALDAAARTGAMLVYEAEEVFDGYYAQQRNAAMMQRLSDWCEAQAMVRADAVIAVSPLAAQHLAARYGRGDVAVVLNSLPYAEREPQPVHRPVRLVIQSSIRDTTRDHVAVEAMAHLRDVAVLTVQGRFLREEYHRQFREIIAQHGLEDVVTLTGRFDPFESVELASSHDVGVAVYPTTGLNLRYTLSNRIFTYLNAGLAVAMPDVPAHRELPGFPQFGVLLSTADAASVAASLRPLLEDPSRIAQMKTAALAAAPQFAWEVQEQILIDTYVRVLSRR